MQPVKIFKKKKKTRERMANKQFLFSSNLFSHIENDRYKYYVTNKSKSQPKVTNKKIMKNNTNRKVTTYKIGRHSNFKR